MSITCITRESYGWILLLATALTMAGADAAPDERVVILGDSITKGYGLDTEEAFPAVIQKIAESEGVEIEVVNAGVSGDTTSGGLRRIGWVLKKKADILVVALGGNDGLRGIDPEFTKKNLKAIVAGARKANPKMKIILAGMQMPDNMGKEYVATFKKVFPEVAKDSKVALVPFLLEGVGADPKFNQADQIHPNAEGQKKIAETVWKYLKPLVAKKKSG